MSMGTATSTVVRWSQPRLIDTREIEDGIEQIYRQSPYSAHSEPDRVFKIVFSCKDGKWHKSDPIYGKIVPATEEHYEFDEPVVNGIEKKYEHLKKALRSIRHICYAGHLSEAEKIAALQAKAYNALYEVENGIL